MMQSSQSRIAEAGELARSGRPGEALRILEQLAGAGDGEALFLLGDAYWTGSAGEQDCQRGRELFRQAAERGQAMAVRAYTNLLASGIAGHRDWTTALRRLRREAEKDGLRAAMLSLIEAMQLDARGDPKRLPQGERVSASPLVVLFPGAFSHQECDYLMHVAEPMYQPSLVGDDEMESSRDPIRSSDGSTIHWLIEDPAIHAMNRRLAALSGSQAEHGEPLQILRYRPGQEYRRHFDWRGAGQARILTALIYLNDDYLGGETEFPKAGLKIRGRKGDALVFRSVGPDGNLDKMSEHAGLPVASGTKYLASRWIRADRQCA